LKIVVFLPTLDGKVLRRRNGLAVAVAMLLALLVLGLSPRPAAAAEDEEGGLLSGFHSYLPATPDLKLPKLKIPFWTDDLKKARAAYRDEKYGKALKLFRSESEDGSMVADWYLGHMYRLGRGVKRDDAMAYSYYSRVAEQYEATEDNDNRLRIAVDSTIRVADYQRTGVSSAGIKRNPQSAARTYLNMATTYGHPAAQYGLGVMNLRGEGMKQNPQQGLKWLIAAARKRHAPAEAYLGELYWQGKYVQADRTRAVMWYMLAARSAHKDENPEIRARLKALEADATEDERLEAAARAKVWDDQYPAKKKKKAQNY
jgi:uncharacterized protein